MKHRIAFVGTCQVRGMRAAAEALGHSDWLVEAHHIGAQMSVEQIAERIAGFDTVVSQVRPDDLANAPLNVASLHGKVGQVIDMPPFVFTGLHPDMCYLFYQGQLLRGAFSDMHSRMVVACYLLGFTAQRTVDLFNAYIFSELGYFDAYPLSYKVMLRQFEAAGYDMYGLPEYWMRTSGQFMWTINHPSISVLSKMAVMALAKAGYVEDGAEAPKNIKDNLHESFVAPVFPALARRYGGEGSTDYLKPLDFGGQRQVCLEDYVVECFGIYANLNPKDLAGDQVNWVREKLATLLR